MGVLEESLACQHIRKVTTDRINLLSDNTT